MTSVLPPGTDLRSSLPEQDPRPVVALPRAGVPGAVIAGGAVVAAIMLFIVMDGQRRGATPTTGSQQAMIASPPALVVPPEPPAAVPSPQVATIVIPASPPAPRTTPAPLPQPTIIIPTAPVEQAPPRQPEPTESRRPQGRLNEPALVVDGGSEVTATSVSSSNATQANDGRPRVAGGVGDDTPARATVIRSRTDVMPIGTLIPAVLETPIDTARPGLVRAVVSRDTAGFDGRRVLVPRGSRLIGEYQSDVRGGQNRVLVTWNRLIRPDGVSIRLGSPTADALGGAGVPGQVHSFFLQRFAGAVLQSALQIGVNIASRPGNGSVIVGVPAAPVNTIGQQLQAANDYRPKITVKQGAVVNIFVARDLDFSGVGTVRQGGK